MNVLVCVCLSPLTTSQLYKLVPGDPLIYSHVFNPTFNMLRIPTNGTQISHHHPQHKITLPNVKPEMEEDTASRATCRRSATTICRTVAVCRHCRTSAALAAAASVVRTRTARATAMWTMCRPCRCISVCRRRRVAAVAAVTSHRRPRIASIRSRIARDVRNAELRTTRSVTTQVRTVWRIGRSRL